MSLANAGFVAGKHYFEYESVEGTVALYYGDKAEVPLPERGKAYTLLSGLKSALQNDTLIIDIYEVETINEIAQCVLQGYLAKRNTWCYWFWEVIQRMRGIEINDPVEKLAAEILDTEAKKTDGEKALWHLHERLYFLDRDKQEGTTFSVEEQLEYLTPYISTLEKAEASPQNDIALEKAINALCKETATGELRSFNFLAAELLFHCQFSDSNIEGRLKEVVGKSLGLKAEKVSYQRQRGGGRKITSRTPIENPYGLDRLIGALKGHRRWDSALRLAQKIEDSQLRQETTILLEIGKLADKGKQLSPKDESFMVSS